MRSIFIDTFYFIALINPSDGYHQRVFRLARELGVYQGVTTESVLIEVGNYFSKRGAILRQSTTDNILDVIENPHVLVLPQSRFLFRAGLNLYGSRLDKGYSLTDCISMCVMKEQGIPEILTHDHHFAQEGFVTLL